MYTEEQILELEAEGFSLSRPKLYEYIYNKGKEKALDRAYDVLADELIWVLHSYGDDVYLQIADSIRTTFSKILEGKTE